jgi:hypothetical protein
MSQMEREGLSERPRDVAVVGGKLHRQDAVDPFGRQVKVDRRRIQGLVGPTSCVTTGGRGPPLCVPERMATTGIESQKVLQRRDGRVGVSEMSEKQ